MPGLRSLRKVMADNVYLLETRLSKPQQSALAAVREVARERGLTVFLVGGAVRDLIGGTAVRDLDVVVQGNALKIWKDIEKAGGVKAGEIEAGQAFFVRFPGGVRTEIGSTLSASYPKPGKAVYRPATILEDLRRRDFTANAMALSLNEGSYGLLMDPLNGVADIENRELRLVSNYGFIEDPVRMIRAARLMARLGWGMDEKTQARYETGKAEGYISALDEFHRGYETEEIFHEEDPLRVMRRLEEEGWMQHLAPALSAGKANLPELERLRESQAQLQTQSVVADTAAVAFPLLTAKMAAKEVEALKKSFPRRGFVDEIDGMEARGKEFVAQFGGKGAAQPSQAYQLILGSEPEAVLWAAHTTKNGALQAKFRSFYTDWPQARQRIPYVLMQEMRITPDLPEYERLLDKLFFELMDGRLGSVEEIKAYLEPYSPPAPPPPVSLRRPRAPKKDAKSAKGRKKALVEAEDAAEEGLPTSGSGVEAASEGSELPGAAGSSGEVSSGAPANGKAARKDDIAPKTEVAAAEPVRDKASKATIAPEAVASAKPTKVAAAGSGVRDGDSAKATVPIAKGDGGSSKGPGAKGAGAKGAGAKPATEREGAQKKVVGRAADRPEAKKAAGGSKAVGSKKTTSAKPAKAETAPAKKSVRPVAAKSSGKVVTKNNAATKSGAKKTDIKAEAKKAEAKKSGVKKSPAKKTSAPSKSAVNKRR